MALAPIPRVTTPDTGTPTVSSYTVDVVAILSQGAQVLEAARPLRATVFIVGELMEHPLESGSRIADHFVKKPIEIDMPLMIAGDTIKQTFSDLRQLYDAGTILTVQTRTGTYDNMVMLGVPHEEVPNALDALTVAVRFREASFVTAKFGGIAPKNKAQASTKKRGTQQTTTANAAKTTKAADQYKGSVLHQLFGGK